MSERESEVTLDSSPQGSIQWAEDHSVSVPGSTQVVFPKMFAIERGGRVVASVDGVFDFKDVPPEHQWQLVSLIQQRGITLVHPQAQPPAKKKETPERPSSLWEKFLSWVSPARLSSLP